MRVSRWIVWLFVGWVMCVAPSAHATLGMCDGVDKIEVESSSGTTGLFSYPTLKAAFDAINSGFHQGSIAIEVCADTTEVASAVLNASGSGGAQYTDISLKPAGGAMRTISGAMPAGSPLLDLAGADHVMIDGLNTGGNGLTISNTTASPTPGTSTIRFIDGAAHNFIKNTTLLGSSTAAVETASGTVLLSTSVIPGGNSYNELIHNRIGPAGPTLPTKGVMSLGSAGSVNSANVIEDNDIFDFFNDAVSVSGIDMQANSDDVAINYNRLYQTAPRTFTGSSLRYAGITLNAANGAFSVALNRIGFAGPDSTGVTSISGSTNTFRGIDAASTSTTLATSIQGNTVSGIVHSTASTGLLESSGFIAITLGTTNGLFNVGNILGNTVGSLDGSSTIIVIASTGSGHVGGIYDASTFPILIANNRIGAITIQGTATDLGFRGITVNSTDSALATIYNNTIANVTNTLVGNNANNGIRVINSPASISGNTVRNLSSNGNGVVVTLSGIVLLSGNATSACSVSHNTIHSLTNTVSAGSAVGAVAGMSLTLPALSNVIERNRVSAMSAVSDVTAYQIYGLLMRGQGTGVFKNNMVSLGLDAQGNPVTTGFHVEGIRHLSGATADYYFNSVYIGGAGIAAASPTYAFRGADARNVQNNAFWNARSNATGSATNFAISVTGTVGTSDHNDLYATGVSGAVGDFNGTTSVTLANWQAATGLDANSLSANPQYLSTTDLHVQPSSPLVGAGISIAGITDDFDVELRPAANPAIGADEIVTDLIFKNGFE